MGGWLMPRPSHFIPGKDPVRRRPGGPEGQSGWVGKISPPPGFNPLTVQPIASCYTVCDIPVDIYSIQVYSILYSNQPAKPVTLAMSSITQLIFNIIQYQHFTSAQTQQ
jgi:hypothetical protein